MASRLLKQVAFGAAEVCLLNQASRRFYRASLVVLCYHGVVAADGGSGRVPFGTTVSAPEFEAQLDYVGCKFTLLSAADLVAHLTLEKPWPPNPIVITFDDGYRNNAIHAAPLLLKKGIPAIFHLTTGYIGGRPILWPEEVFLRIMDWTEPVLDSPVRALRRAALPGERSARQRAAQEIREACKRIPVEERDAFLAYLRARTPPVPSGYASEVHDFMNWEEARWLAEQGFELGSHTVSHPILTHSSPETVAAELGESRSAIEQQTSARCRFLAYPNGSRADFSAAVMQAAEAAGYLVAFSVENRRAGAAPPRLAVPRLAVPGQVPLPTFQSKVSGLYALLGRGR